VSNTRQTVPKTPRVSSLPKASVNQYLDLYVLTRKRTKLELEMQALVKRKNSIADELLDLDREIGKIGSTIYREDGKKSREVPRRDMKETYKTIVMDY